MRFTTLLLLATTMLMSAEPVWREYMAPPTTLGALVAQMDRDFGDLAPQVVKTVLNPASLTSKPTEVNSYTIYAGRRFAWLEQTPGYLQGLLRHAASDADATWVTGDARVLMLAYASVKAGRPIDGVTFDPAKVFSFVPPKQPPTDPKQLEIK